MFTYFHGDADDPDFTDEISAEEYADFLEDDAEFCGESKSTAKRVVRENRQEARETGSSYWTLMDGSQVVIKFEKKKV